MVIVSPGIQVRREFSNFILKFARWSAIGLGAVVGLFSGRRTNSSDKIIEKHNENIQIISEHSNQPINNTEINTTTTTKMPADDATELEWTKYLQNHV